MNKAILTVVMAGVATVSFGVSGVAFAGNAHGAATAGMTYHGDPISSPWTTKPAGWNMGQSGSGSGMPAVASDASESAVSTHAQVDAQ
jgi:hypothetical protein